MWCDAISIFVDNALRWSWSQMDFFDDEFQPAKRLSFDENPLGDLDDIDDDFEFDRESRAIARSPSASPKSRASRHSESRKKSFRTKAKKTAKVPSRVRDLAYESGVDRYAFVSFFSYWEVDSQDGGIRGTDARWFA